MPSNSGARLILRYKHMGKVRWRNACQCGCARAQWFQHGWRFRRGSQRAGTRCVSEAKVGDATFRLDPMHDEWTEGKLSNHVEESFLFGQGHDFGLEHESARSHANRKERQLICGSWGHANTLSV